MWYTLCWFRSYPCCMSRLTATSLVLRQTFLSACFTAYTSRGEWQIISCSIPFVLFYFIQTRSCIFVLYFLFSVFAVPVDVIPGSLLQQDVLKPNYWAKRTAPQNFLNDVMCLSILSIAWVQLLCPKNTWGFVCSILSNRIRQTELYLS